MLYLDSKVGDLKTWELYVGLVFIQLLIGIVIALCVGIFDLVGIRGAFSQLVKQIAVILNAQNPQKYGGPILAEVNQGKIF